MGVVSFVPSTSFETLSSLGHSSLPKLLSFPASISHSPTTLRLFYSLFIRIDVSCVSAHQNELCNCDRLVLRPQLLRASFSFRMRDLHPTPGSVGKQERHVVVCDCDSTSHNCLSACCEARSRDTLSTMCYDQPTRRTHNVEQTYRIYAAPFISRLTMLLCVSPLYMQNTIYR